MFDLFIKGGMVMYPILLCSIISIAIILERGYQFLKIKTDLASFLLKIEQTLESNQIDEALRQAKSTRGPVAAVAEVGLNYYQKDTVKWEKLVHRVGTRELDKLEKNLRLLGIIAHISPLLGLLGTVTGMISAFQKIQELGGGVDAAVLAGGIWEALLTTAFGLIVAIPSMFAYHHFEGKVDNIDMAMKDVVNIISGSLMFGVEKERIHSNQVKYSDEDIDYGV